MLRPFGRTRNAAHSLIYKQIKFRESTISRSLMATSLVCSCFFRPTHVLETPGDLFKGRTHSCKISRKTREERNWTGWYAKRTIRRECSKQRFTNGTKWFQAGREKTWKTMMLARLDLLPCTPMRTLNVFVNSSHQIGESLAGWSLKSLVVGRSI